MSKSVLYNYNDSKSMLIFVMERPTYRLLMINDIFKFQLQLDNKKEGRGWEEIAWSLISQ
jgi:hypothetical protein